LYQEKRKSEHTEKPAGKLTWYHKLLNSPCVHLVQTECRIKWFSERSDHSLINRRPYSPTGDGWQPRQRRRFCFVPRDTVNHHAGSYTTWPPRLCARRFPQENHQCRRYTSKTNQEDRNQPQKMIAGCHSRNEYSTVHSDPCHSGNTIHRQYRKHEHLSGLL
jgi:hypothetical protein